MYNMIEKGVWLDYFLVLVHQEVFGDCPLEAGIESRDLMTGLACITPCIVTGNSSHELESPTHMKDYIHFILAILSSVYRPGSPSKGGFTKDIAHVRSQANKRSQEAE